MHAARTIMSQRSLTDVTVQAITEAADVGKGTFFNYFQSKEHIFTRVVELNRRSLVRTIERVRSGDRSNEEAIADLLISLMCLPSGSDWLMYETNTLRALSTQPEARRGFSEQVRTNLPLYEQLMELGQARGTTRRDLTGEELAAVTHCFLAGMQILQWIHNTAPTPDAISNIVSTYCKLLAPPTMTLPPSAPAPSRRPARKAARPLRRTRSLPTPSTRAKARPAGKKANTKRRQS